MDLKISRDASDQGAGVLVNVRFWPKADVQKILFLEFAYALQLTR